MTAERQQDWLDQLGVAFEHLCSGADSPLAYHFTDCQVLAGRSRFARRVNPKRKTKRGELARDAVFTPTEVRPMLNAAGFNFSKVPSSELLRVSGNLPSELKFLAAGYLVLINKFPMFPAHCLVASKQLTPQMVTETSVRFMLELFLDRPSSFQPFAAYFNSWSAGASVNHLHWHICQCSFPLFASSELRGIAQLKHVGPHVCDWPARPLVWLVRSASDVAPVAHDVFSYCSALQNANIPHNIACSSCEGAAVVAVFARSPDPRKRGRLVIGVDVGCAELCGDFTFYAQDEAEQLSDDELATFLKATTLPPQASAYMRVRF